MQWIKRAAIAALIALIPGVAQATIISRLQLDHPALGTAGGSALYTKINDIYLKLGNSIDSRYFEITGLANSATTDLEHNFKTAFATLRFDVYSWNTGTGELTLLTTLTTPTRASIGISATPSFLTTKTRITNSSGASRDLVVIVHHDPTEIIALRDVNVTSPTNGQVLTYDTASLKWKNLPQSGGGGGGGASWVSPAGTGALLTDQSGLPGLQYYDFPDVSDVELAMWILVPSSYTAGNPMSLDLSAYTPGSGAFVFKTVTTLIVQNTDNITDNTNQKTSTATFTVITSNSPINGTLALTDGSGLINGQTVSAGDTLKVKLTRDYANGSDNVNVSAKMMPGSTQLRTF